MAKRSSVPQILKSLGEKTNRIATVVEKTYDDGFIVYVGTINFVYIR